MTFDIVPEVGDIYDNWEVFNFCKKLENTGRKQLALSFLYFLREHIEKTNETKGGPLLADIQSTIRSLEQRVLNTHNPPPLACSLSPYEEGGFLTL